MATKKKAPRRPKPVTPKGGFTATKRRYCDGGKVKK